MDILLAVVAGVLALLAAFFGLKFKFKREGRQELADEIVRHKGEFRIERLDDPKDAASAVVTRHKGHVAQPDHKKLLEETWDKPWPPKR